MNPFTPEQLMQESDRLFAYAFTRVGNRETAEDLVQDVLVAAWEKRSGFDGRSKLSTWLFGILKFKILDHYRVQKRTPTSQAAEPIDNEEWGGDPLDQLFDARGSWKIDPNYGMETFAETPVDEAKRNDILSAVRGCMDGLSERLRLLFSLREIDQLPVSEVAAAAGVTPGSAAVLLTRARHQLRACLQRQHIAP